MLVNSFSYLPVLNDGTWHVVSDYGVAHYIRVKSELRKERLAQTLGDAVKDTGIKITEAVWCFPDEEVEAALKNNGRSAITAGMFPKTQE